MEKATLKHQLLLPIIALITVLFGCYGYLSYKIKSNQLWSELSKSIDRTENRLKKNLSGPIWGLDENASKSILISELLKESIDTRRAKMKKMQEEDADYLKNWKKPSCSEFYDQFLEKHLKQPNDVIEEFRLPTDLIRKPFTMTEYLGKHKADVY